ncbi:MAG: ParB/RepB/Spo0J family partition protein [Chloroflexi bacterium]|nr:MAG: ParB/RepB/Spo0J family partition protein [Chloroflexota bacterium]
MQRRGRIPRSREGAVGTMSQSRPRGLGRGLDALIPMSSEGEALVPQMIAVDQIRPSRQQVRSRFDAEPLGELAESIRKHGVLQPLLVRPLADGYELIAGERRWRAARLAGLTTVPAVVRSDAGNDAQLVLGLIENLQRTDLDAIEEARGLRRLIEEFGLTHEEVADRLGKHRVSVTQSLRLLGGCAAVQSAVASSVISAGHARALIALESQATQEQGLKVVIAKHLSVRQTENWVRTYRPRRRRHVDSSSELRAVAADIESSLGLPVKLDGNLNRGKLEVRYSSREELERVCAKLVS